MDRNAFNQLIHKLNRRLYILAYGILRNKQEAEDVVQDAFIKMWTMKRDLDRYDDPCALAVTITRNKCIDRLRRLKFTDGGKDGSDISGIDPSPSPYDKLVSSENVQIINNIIRNLPSNYREVIDMKEIRGLSYEEISQLNDVNINTLRVNLSRARQLIKQEYLKYINERRRAEKNY